jgi:dienelactone hydrolase
MACCPTKLPPVVGDLNYQRKGKTIKLHDFDLYEVGQGNKVVFVIYDVFALHPNAYQGCDILAEGGLRVVMPDYFKGDEWKGGFDDIPKFMEWLGKVAAKDILQTVTNQTFEHLEKELGQDFTAGFLGYCWGAKQTFWLAAENKRIKAIGGIHPSFTALSDAQIAQVPVMLLNSKDEAPMEDIQAELNAKPFAAKNIWKVYPTMHHGWCAARGDWTDAEQAKNANEALGISADFFLKNI